MSMQDPIADMLTRIRNASMRKLAIVDVPYSKHKLDILEVLQTLGYIISFNVSGDVKKNIHVHLKYQGLVPVIREIKRVSKASRRIYMGCLELGRNKFKSGLGNAIISTSKGIMSDKDAIKNGLGGEVLFYISV